MAQNEKGGQKTLHLMAEKPHNAKGYKALIVEKPRVPDFHRPHRKELMHNIFRDTPTYERETSPGVDHDSHNNPLAKQLQRKLYTNHLAAAIDLLNPQQALPYSLRAPIKVPPNYKAKLTELDPIIRDIRKKGDKKESMVLERERAKVKLHFLPAPAKGELVEYDEQETANKDISSTSEAESTKIEVTLDQDPSTPQVLISDNAYDNIRISTTEGRNSSSSLEKDNFGPLAPSSNLNSLLPSITRGRRISILEGGGNKSGENWQSRNVPYMLQIWEKAEGINLSLLHAGQQIIHSLRHDERNESPLPIPGIVNHTSNTIEAENTLNLLAKQIVISKSMLSDSGEESKEKHESQIFKPLTAKENVHTISTLTLDLLKRISRDINDASINAEAEHALVQRTLTGFDPNNPLERIETLALEVGGPVEKKDSKFESPFKNISPGMCYKAIGTFISDNGDLILTGNQTKIPPYQNKELILSEYVHEDIPSSASSSNTKKVKTQKGLLKDIANQDEIIENSNMVTEKLRQTFGSEIVIPLKNEVSNTFQPTYLKSSQPKPSVVSNRFNAKRLWKTLKEFVQKDTISLEEKIIATNFLESGTSRITTVPAVNSKEREELLKCILMGLRNEESRSLVFESASVLIQIEAESQLSRWDSILFKQATNDILESGLEDQKQTAALLFVRQGQVDARVLNQIRNNLGSLEEDSRQEALKIICTANLELTENVVAICAEASVHSNWRIRFDVVQILKAWIPRIAPPESSAPPIRDPDALDTDDDVTMKALFSNIGNLDRSEEVAEDPAKSTNGVTATNASNHSGSAALASPKYMFSALYFNCIEILLKLMTGDWSNDVQKAASNVVNVLRLGTIMFEWIITTLESIDPVKRMDSLRCLTCIGVIHAKSLPVFLKCFKDPYSSVRIEACKVAESLSCSNRRIISAVLDLLDDHEYKVRAHAIKALGSSKCTAAKVRECLNWALQHDANPAVRSEAIQAVYDLGLIQEDIRIKQGVLTLLTSDASDLVKKEAERILILAGIIFPSMAGAGEDEVRTTIDGNAISPYPHLLGDRPPEDVAIFLRKSLVGEKEVFQVIEQVQLLSTKDAVMTHVDELVGAEGIKNKLDLQFDAPFIPQTAKKVKRNRLKSKVKLDKNSIPQLI